MRPDELHHVAVGDRLRLDFARALPPGSPRVRPRSGWLSSRLIAFCTASSSLFRRRLTSSGTSSAYSSAAFVPGRGLYLKMKLFLNRASRTRSHRLLEILLRLAAEADDEIAGHGRVGHRRADPREHLAVLLDRVAALHPPQHRVRAALGRHVQVRARPSAGRGPPASRSSVMCRG